MTVPNFGHLERVDLRAGWTSEASDFTPWLARPENLKLLGDAIGLELELEAQEKDVGPFRADVLCKETLSGSRVLIENQLEPTDHKHLGQLLTYAAGLEATTIIWVAGQIRDEHRAALDWLNSITSEEINFFGLEIELWRILDSPMAPKFNVVSEPNDWSKRVAEATKRIELTETQKLQLDFWTRFRELAERRGSKLRLLSPLPQSWIWISIGKPGFGLAAVASTYNSAENSYDGHELRAELVMNGANSASAYAALKREKGSIESELGQPLVWYDALPGARTYKAFFRRSADLGNRTAWPEYFNWLLEHLESLNRVFAPRVVTLKLPEEGGGGVPEDRPE